ncbi:FMN-binding protein [Acetobacterium fimetarium]|uniref:FMN-binding protein n=1 Tax=Acetobacterium fimetarium TaxID=52691 RepID=A0ABR6WVK1_9FIRM|nr:FMN-binding protein [Acetobacterium fimetarium]MBC3804548.1 FMN-binding protein [Acetobacterium fimetarium]
MTLFINVATAWISVALAVLLAIIYILRILNKGKRKSKLISKINRKLRNTHKPMGIAFVVFACIHGFFSSGAILSFNFGTLCMLMGILLGLTYLFRKIFPQKLSWIKPHRGLTVVLLAFLGLHLWQVGGIIGPQAFFTGVTRELETSVEELYGSTETTSDERTTQTDVVLAAESDSNTNPTESVVTKANLFLGNVDLKDGTYTGVADGYGPDLTVSVTVAGNVITAVQVVSHNEQNEKYYGRAIYAVPDAIIAAQTPVVDTISGATYTSKGIMKAVVNALQGAVISGTLPSI